MKIFFARALRTQVDGTSPLHFGFGSKLTVFPSGCGELAAARERLV